MAMNCRKSTIDTTGLNIYELACTLSHLKAIKQAYDDGLNDVLIMEMICIVNT